jgi:hypothetical protein
MSSKSARTITALSFVDPAEIVARLERDENAFVRFLVNKIREDIREEMDREADRPVAPEPCAAPSVEAPCAAGRLYFINPAKDLKLTILPASPLPQGTRK